jgi:hypothetical protein
MFHPSLLRPLVTNWEDVAEALVRRVRRECVAGVEDGGTTALLAEVLGYPGVPPSLRGARLGAPLLPVLPISFARHNRRFNFFSTVTTLGTPQDITAQEMRIECFFPADGETARAARQLTEGKS